MDAREGNPPSREDWELLLSFLPRNWQELAVQHGALKRLRKNKSAEHLLRVLLLHFGCGHSLQETVVRARQAGLAEPVGGGLVEALEKVAGLVARAVWGVIPRARRRAGRERGAADGGDRRHHDQGTRQDRFAVATAL